MAVGPYGGTTAALPDGDEDNEIRVEDANEICGFAANEIRLRRTRFSPLCGENKKTAGHRPPPYGLPDC